MSLPGDNGEKAWNVTINVSGRGRLRRRSRPSSPTPGFEYQGVSERRVGIERRVHQGRPHRAGRGRGGDGDQWTANYTVTNAETNHDRAHGSRPRSRRSLLVPAVLAGCSARGAEPGGGNTGDNGAATSGPAPEDGDARRRPGRAGSGDLPDGGHPADRRRLSRTRRISAPGGSCYIQRDDANASFDDGEGAARRRRLHRQTRVEPGRHQVVRQLHERPVHRADLARARDVSRLSAWRSAYTVVKKG